RDFLQARLHDPAGRPVEGRDVAELLRPDALGVPHLEGEALVVVAEYHALGAIGEAGGRGRMIGICHQLRAAVDGAPVDHDSVAGARFDQQAGFACGQWRPEPRGARNALTRFHHVVPPDERDRPALSSYEFRSLPNVLAMLRVRIDV